MTEIDKGAVAAGLQVSREALEHTECNTCYFHGERVILERVPSKTPKGRNRDVHRMKWGTISREFYSKKNPLNMNH